MRFTAMIALAIVLLSLAAADDSENTIQKRYAIESAVVEYSLEGMQTGSEVLYFKDWGQTEARYSDAQISMFGFSEKNRIMALVKDGWIYTVDLATNQGTKMESPAFSEIAESFGEDDVIGLGEKVMTSMGGKRVGTEKFLGRTCEIWEFSDMSTKTWIWQGISLKVVVNMNGMEMITRAVKIDVDSKIPSEKFELPEGVVIKDLPDLPEGMEDFNPELFEQLMEKK